MQTRQLNLQTLTAKVTLAKCFNPGPLASVALLTVQTLQSKRLLQFSRTNERIYSVLKKPFG